MWQRSLLFVFISGHFRLPELAVDTDPLWQATGRWLAQHRDLWDGKAGHRQAVAGVTREHLGATQWRDDTARSRYGPTGRADYELIYTGNEEMERIYQSASRLQSVRRPVTLRPANDLYFGEGAELYSAGIPTISLVPAPTYLCAARPDSDLDKVEVTLAHQQLQTFTRVLEEILRQTLWQLQSCLGSQTGSIHNRLLLVQPERIQLNSGTDLWLDVAVFEQTFTSLQQLAGRELSTCQVKTLQRAAELYQRPLLQGWYEEWCLREHERLQRMYLVMLDKLMDYSQVHHDYEVGLFYAMRSLCHQRTREKTHRRLMRLHYFAGDRA